MIKIELHNTTLRSFCFGDEHAMVKHANNRNIWNNVRNHFPHPYYLDDAINWVEQNQGIPTPTNLAITVNNEVVGGISITLQQDVSRLNAEIGYWLGETYWGKGIMTESVKGMVDYVFENFNLIRLFAGVFDYNAPSMKVLEKAGFKLEAIHEKAIYKNGKLHDEHLYVILNPQFHLA